jgi:hypothetical protein
VIHGPKHDFFLPAGKPDFQTLATKPAEELSWMKSPDHQSITTQGGVPRGTRQGLRVRIQRTIAQPRAEWRRIPTPVLETNSP